MSEGTCTYIKDEPEIREKRITLLLQVWELLLEKKQVNKNEFFISVQLVNEVVEHYLADLKIIKCRYRIEHKIQLHKIAGLITALIARYRPIVPVNRYTNQVPYIYANELFAITHGLAICGEYSLDICENLANKPWFDQWLNDFMYLLHCRNYTPESLIFIYQTLTHFVFANNFNTRDL